MTADEFQVVFQAKLREASQDRLAREAARLEAQQTATPYEDYAEATRKERAAAAEQLLARLKASSIPTLLQHIRDDVWGVGEVEYTNRIAYTNRIDHRAVAYGTGFISFIALITLRHSYQALSAESRFAGRWTDYVCSEVHGLRPVSQVNYSATGRYATEVMYEEIAVGNVRARYDRTGAPEHFTGLSIVGGVNSSNFVLERTPSLNASIEDWLAGDCAFRKTYLVLPA